MLLNYSQTLIKKNAICQLATKHSWKQIFISLELYNNNKNLGALLAVRLFIFCNFENIEHFLLIVEEKDDKTENSIFPIDNYELIYGNWEKDIIWDDQNMDFIPTPTTFSFDPNDENIILKLPEEPKSW